MPGRWEDGKQKWEERCREGGKKFIKGFRRKVAGKTGRRVAEGEEIHFYYIFPSYRLPGKKSPIKVNNKARIWQKWHIVFKIIPWILVIGILKFLANQYDWEVLELNALFTSLVAGTVFLIGFLVSGVLSDYKESEKLPSELTGTIKNLFDDTYTIYKSKNSATALRFIEFQQSFIDAVADWFYKREKTAAILNKIGMMNDFFAELDKEGVQPNYIIKMKNEQNAIRKMIMRIDTIRDTEFVSSGYAIVESMGALITISLILIRIEPFYASLLFTLLVNFLILYMFLLIKDLDNPFDYSTKGETGTEIPLLPLHHLASELKGFRSQ